MCRKKMLMLIISITTLQYYLLELSNQSGAQICPCGGVEISYLPIPLTPSSAICGVVRKTELTNDTPVSGIKRYAAIIMLNLECAVGSHGVMN